MREEIGQSYVGIEERTFRKLFTLMLSVYIERFLDAIAHDTE